MKWQLRNEHSSLNFAPLPSMPFARMSKPSSSTPSHSTDIFLPIGNSTGLGNAAPAGNPFVVVMWNATLGVVLAALRIPLHRILQPSLATISGETPSAGAHLNSHRPSGSLEKS